MRQFTSSIALAVLLVSSPLLTSQSSSAHLSASAASVRTDRPTSTFLAGSPLNVSLLVQRPPSDDSAITTRELKELHALEQSRSPQEVAAAQADDTEEDIFVYKGIFGDGFTPENLPILATLSADVHREEGIASLPLKESFARLRPYQNDRTLHPVCKLTKAPNSYPSGHALSGYLLGYTLANIVPAKRDQILARTDEYAFHRLVCGVHYPSDLAASRAIASAMFGVMISNSGFRSRMESAREELQTKLSANAASNH